MNDKKSIAVFIIFSGIVGIMMALQFKTQINIVGLNVFPNQKLNELTSKLENIEIKRKESEEKLEYLEDKLNEIEEEYSVKNKDIKKLYNDRLEYSILLGIEDVYGEGVVIEIKEPIGEKRSIVEDYKLILNIITVLNDNGAESVAVNGHRYSNFTKIVPGDDNILYNNIELYSPIEISAIGNPTNLERGLKVRRGILWEMENKYGYSLDIKKVKEIRIKKYGEKEKLKYSQPIYD